jgi:hypothetical protein
MGVERYFGRGEPCLNEQVHTRESLCKSQEFLLTFEKNSPAPFFHQREIAHELDRIAKTLLVVHENGLPVERRPVPAGLRKNARRDSPLRIFDPETPCVFFPSLTESSEQQE